MGLATSPLACYPGAPPWGMGVGVVGDCPTGAWARCRRAVGLLVLIGIYGQLRIEDTPVFRDLQQRSARSKREAGLVKAPLLEAVRRHWREILQAAGAFFVVNATFYILISGMLDYATKIATKPFFGALTDRMGTRKRLYVIGTVCMAAFAFPMFWKVTPDRCSPCLRHC